MRYLYRLCVPHTARLHAQRGAGVLEIMIAALIVAFVAIGMVEFFAKGRIWFDQEEHKRVATLLAQEALERTVAQSYGSINDWNEVRSVDNHDYDIQVTVTANSPATDLKTIRSVVTWDATDTAERTVSLTTIVYNN
jgi:Tfp pilus assembly protein PilV